MRDIVFENVFKSYKNELILDNFSLTIPGGKFFALLGPSGCGKTTVLRLIGGFEIVDQGKIYLGNENISYVPPHNRRVNTVFQNYALFPHFNVFENIAYALSIRNIHKDIIKQKVEKLASSFGITKYLHKSIYELSGGQQQRVAIARAIINEPDVLLLDEPLSALDFKLREKMLVELVELQDQLKTTFVYVTHDQFEALTLADSMAIMSEGGIVQQVGSPKEIYEYPKTSFVAHFVGTTNSFFGRIKIGEDPRDINLDVEGIGLLKINAPEDIKLRHGTVITMSIRPEKIIISTHAQEGYSNRMSGYVKSIVYYGRATEYIIVCGEHTISVFEQNEEHTSRDHINYDDTIYIHWHPESAVLLER